MMAVPSRLQSSTPPSLNPSESLLEKELQPVITSLEHIGVHGLDHAQWVTRTSWHLQHIRQILVDSPHSFTRDVFRRLHGFEVLLSTLRTASTQHGSSSRTSTGRASFIEVAHFILGTLAEALDDHIYNRKYFGTRTHGSAWAKLEQYITGVVANVNGEDHKQLHLEDAEELFGLLFSFALKDEAIRSLFGNLGRNASELHQDIGDHDLRLDLAKTSILVETNALSRLEWQNEIRKRVQKALGQRPLLRNPEILQTISSVWLTLCGIHGHKNTRWACLSASVPTTINEILRSSKFNLSAASSTTMISAVLPRLFDADSPLLDAILWRRIADILITQGLSNMKDTRMLFRVAMRSSEATEFLLEAVRSSRVPAHIQFDLSLHGFSSIELPALGHNFLPSSSAGYSFTAWIYVDRFDLNIHTTIFGAFDSTQTCFILAYFEKDTRNFILQTSISSSKPSVRFKSHSFEARRWYHIGLVHARSRTMALSKASLFVDGELIEQLHCRYPSTPPSITPSTDSIASISSSPKEYHPIQAFLGTPRDLSTRLGQGMTCSQWSLASFHLFDNILSRDLITVYYRLGPRYNGNFQDCLGPFQTYDASAALNLRNETVYAGKTDKSPLVAAIRLKAGSILPEHRIIVSIFPSAIYSQRDLGRTWLPKLLSKRAARNLQHLTHQGNYAVVINGAVPSISEGLTKSHGVATLAGEPVILFPLAIDNATWQVGGCAAVGLKMIELADEREDVVRAVEFLLEAVKNSWRNSEVMERENAFGILGLLLRMKMGISTSAWVNTSLTPISGGVTECHKLSFQLLSLILGFVGFRHENPTKSLIVNPLAYRILLVDNDMWGQTTFVTQKLYYEQFVLFAVGSNYHQFNWKRLARMRKTTPSVFGLPI